MTMPQDLHTEGWRKTGEGEKHMVFSPYARPVQVSAPDIFNSLYEESQSLSGVTPAVSSIVCIHQVRDGSRTHTRRARFVLDSRHHITCINRSTTQCNTGWKCLQNTCYTEEVGAQTNLTVAPVLRLAGISGC